MGDVRDRLEIFAWGKHVGTLRLDPATQLHGIAYSREWIEQTQDLAPLMTPRRPGFHTSPKLAYATWHGLPGFLAGSLPDDFGTALIRTTLQQRGQQTSTLDQLSALGPFAMGALEFEGETTTFSGPLRVERLVEAANRAVNGQLDTLDDEGMSALLGVGSVAGGQRAKAVVGLDEQTMQLCDGRALVLPEGYAHWLIKFDGVMPHSKDGTLEPGTARGKGRVEYAYFLMARAAGLAISDSLLLEEHGRAHFMTRRFDRQGGNKQHIATLCDMAHLDYKSKATHSYDDLLDVITRLELGGDAKHQAFRRMCFNVMAKNHDDHTKNFSFIMEEGGPWHLAPAYDLTHANNPKSEWVHQHLMGVNGKFKDITREDLRQVGARWNVPGVAQALDTVAGVVSCWNDFAQAAGVASGAADTIRKDLQPLGPGMGKRKPSRTPSP